MFDILGVLHLTEQGGLTHPLRNAFCQEPWNKSRDLVCSSVRGRSFDVVYLEHKPAGDSYYAQDTSHLFVVGEVFSNARGQSSGRLPTGKLSARDVFRLYGQVGTDFLQYLKGNFTLVLLDECSQQYYLFNSRFGISPFYYTLIASHFVFSTSITALLECKVVESELDYVAIAEAALFNYPLRDRTFFRRIKALLPAEIVQVDESGLEHKIYWDPRTLYSAKLYSRRNALELGSELFYKVVNDLSREEERVRVSFTSGFDSRAVVAVLEKDYSDLLGYSFGIPGSLNVSIPEMICAELGMPFKPIYLDNEYEKVFEEYALQAVVLSDCLSTVERANYPYAFKRLRDFSPVVVTGLFGSELMRTFQNVGHIVSANLVRLNKASDVRQELERIITETGSQYYLKAELIMRGEEEIAETVEQLLANQFGDFPPDQRFYLFLLTEGLRKYFGAEVHMERLYGTNRFPFLDDDFVEFLFQAPFAGVHSRALRPTVGNRFNSQYFYAYVIRKYRPELLQAPTDHGYPPSDVLSPVALLKIGPKVLYWHGKRKWMGYEEFKTVEWTEALYNHCLFKKPCEGSLFSAQMQEDFRSGAWKVHRLEFARAASLKIWLDTLKDSNNYEQPCSSCS